MNGMEDEIQTLPVEDPSSLPVEDRPKLKRLKKASEVADALPENASVSGEAPDPDELSALEALLESPGEGKDSDDGFGDHSRLYESGVESSDFGIEEYGSERVDELQKKVSAKRQLNLDEAVDNSMKKSSNEGKDFDDGLDPLFGGHDRLYESGFESLDFEIEENEGGVGDCKKKGSAKRRLDLYEAEEKPKKKIEISGKSQNQDGKSKESAREKKKLEKERKMHLEQLHAESQKLLRETRDASFQPAIVAEKPISSVLEKIRMRKHELLKITSATNDGDQPVQAQCSAANTDVQEPEQISRSEENTSGSGLHESRNDSQPCDNANELSMDDDLGQTSDSSDESSSFSEEDNDKENINPVPKRSSSINLYGKNDLVQGFVDEEAEEEDDSDHDMMRFQDDDDDEGEDDDNDEAEILTDLIAPGFKEKSSDADKRNELHQKWLQFQDASDTDNLLQRLNSHATNTKAPLMIQDDDDVDNDGENDEDDDDEEEDNLDPPLVNSARQNVLKAKKSISLMFTDAEEAYVSDDEEIDMNVLRSSISLDHSLDKTSVLAPADDENSREVFDLIRKTNSLPEKPNRKSSNLTGNFGTLAIKGGRISFKQSFLGRATANGMTSSSRHVSSGARSFIFARDDSNSRSCDLPENVPDAVQPPKPKVVEKSTLRRASDDSSSGGSLFKVLRRTCEPADQSLLTSVTSVDGGMSSSQTVRQFSAFRLAKKTS